jgi:lipopolysaccharide export system permease protein
MPILWRYVLRHFFQIFLLCVTSFIGVLLVLRFQEIARFASSGAGFFKILSFMLLQVPYILPITIPISCLIAAILLFQKLSHTHELTAFRACGLGLKPIMTPLLFAALLLTLFNFIITCEVTPRSRGRAKALIYEMAAQNPLFLLQKESLLKLKNAYADISHLSVNQSASDLLLAFKNTSTDRLALVFARSLYLDQNELKGENVAILSSVDSKKEAGFDHLVIENQAEMDTLASNFTQLTPHGGWEASYEYLPLRGILAGQQVGKGFSRGAILEIARRISLALAAFTFTFIGMAFGLDIGRHRSKKKLAYAIALAALYLICFVVAKSFRHSPYIAALMLLLIHPLLLLLSLKSLTTVARGIE